jgi:hypothetical protein
LQALLSNGAAPESSATLRIMQDMHPPRTEPLNMHAPPAARPEVSAAQAGSFLYMTAANDSTCVDVFGWASDFLFHVRATGFKHQLARLTARVGNADVSDTVAMVLTCGWLLALHKDDLAKQAERTSKGLDPKLRPVNIGTALLKWGCKCSLRTKPAREAARAMSDIQMGLGAKRGVERTAHHLSALWRLDHALLSIDFVNGFNALLRQVMLDAVNKRCPQLNHLFMRATLFASSPWRVTCR